MRAVLQESPDAKLADLRRAAQLAGGNKYYTNMVEATLKQQAHSKELTFWEKAALGMGAVGLIAVGVGVKEPHDAAVREEELQKIITESRGTKMRCPERECNGTGRVLRMVFVWVPREYSWADPFPTDKTQEWRKHEEKCDRCDGKGWVWVDK